MVDIVLQVHMRTEDTALSCLFRNFINEITRAKHTRPWEKDKTICRLDEAIVPPIDEEDELVNDILYLCAEYLKGHSSPLVKEQNEKRKVKKGRSKRGT